MIRLKGMTALLLGFCFTTLLSSCGGGGGSSTNPASPTWAINMTNTPPSFAAGQSGSYTINVSNSGSGATTSGATVADTLPTGLSATAASGTGWTCIVASSVCTRSDVLAAGQSYPAINLSVNVAQNATGNLTNQATISGGGAPNATTNISTPINSPAWTINMTSTPPSFVPGQPGSYTINVSNSGSGTTSGSTTVTDTLPTSLPATAMSGTGWTCTVTSATCDRSDALAAGQSYPAINLSVNVAQNATGNVSNQATISGGGAANATANLSTPISTPSRIIKHVVIIFQENRSTDNLFHDPVLMNRGADIATTGVTSTGQTITLVPISLQAPYDVGHSHNSFLSQCQWNGTECAMTGADLVPCDPGPPICPTDASFAYVQASDIQPYFTMAETYTFNDRMFQTNQGDSFPAHQYILSGTAAICTPGGNCPSGTTSAYFAIDNPIDNGRPDGSNWGGCLAPPQSLLYVMNTTLPFPNPKYSQIGGPECFEHPTLTDLLDQAGLTWKYYASSAGYIWTAPNAIEHMCQPTGDPEDLVCSGPDWTNPDPNVVIEGTRGQILTDIQNGQLANVAWVTPDGQASDHSGGNQGLGPSWVASIVNAIGQSPYWDDTAIFVTWDDWGGWYEHVPPVIRSTNSSEFGFRVPLLAISAYAKPAYISHQNNDFGSLLRFVEETFSLPEIYPSVGYADSYALGDMSDCFDFTQTPLPFSPIPSAQDADFFIHNHTTPSPPDND
jgi:phospholipase C